MEESDVLVSSVEIVKDSLYFDTFLPNYIPRSLKKARYCALPSNIAYESFFFDYGPYHLCHLFIFCTRIHLLRMLDKRGGSFKAPKVIFYTSNDKVLRLNAAYLIGSYAIIYEGMEPGPVFELVTQGDFELLTFRDASGSLIPIFEISLLDVFEGLHKAYSQGFFDFENFSKYEYMHYEKVLNGDLNWIIPDKMLAFSGPHSNTNKKSNSRKLRDDYPLHKPMHYYTYFKENNVSDVVRLNQKTYNAEEFSNVGFVHSDLFFLDGSVPSDYIVDRFNKICEQARGAVAVHCKAGLGRTGTLIGCYLMKHHAFTARQAIGWLRICRPGSVIGFQQNFLVGIQDRMMSEGVEYRRIHGIKEIPKFKVGIYHRYKPYLVKDADLDNVENVPSVKSSDTDDQALSEKQNNEDFVSLGSIINSNQKSLSPIKESQKKAKTSIALANAKNTSTSNKNSYMTSNNLKSTTLIKVQTTYTPKKMQSSTSNVTSSSIKSTSTPPTKGSAASPLKIGLPKSQGSKVCLYSRRANLARNHGQGYSLSAGPLKTYTRKTPTGQTSTAVQDSAKKSKSESLTTDKTFDANLNFSIDSTKGAILTNTDSSTKLDDNLNRKKMMKKKLQKVTKMETIKDLKNCNISNSDSERDSTNTTLTNISADSLENIPCKIATRRNKSKSPELMQPLGECTNNGIVHMDGELDPQGAKLCQIKAARKTASSLVNNVPKKEGVKTRNYSNALLAKKK